MRADSLDRLAHAVLQPGFDGTDAPDWIRRRLADGLGSVLLFARNISDAEQTAALTASLRSENPDVIVVVDEEGGDVTRLDAAEGSAYPGNLALGAADDVRLTESVALSLGARLAQAGIGLNYAPDVDVNSNPNNPVIGVRAFGAEPALVARHAAAWVRGLQRAGVGACAKHFPGHGDTSVDSHYELPTVHATLDQLFDVAMPPFKAAVDAGVRAVMLGHLLVPSVDPDKPASVSSIVVEGLLRKELGFTGLIVSDAMEMRAIADRHGLERAVVMALAAGVDLVCIGHSADDEIVGRLRNAVTSAVAEGELGEGRLHDAAESVRRFAQWSSTALRSQSSDMAPDQTIGLVAARRALMVAVNDPGVLPLTSAPHVVTFTTQGPAALGTIAETSLGRELAAILPGTTNSVLGECSDAALTQALTDASNRPLVLAVRSAHRHPWMLAALNLLLEARSDAVVAEMGLPGTGPLGAAYLLAHGASRVCAAAVAEMLTQSSESAR